MIKVHFVGVRAIFGTRSDKKSPPRRPSPFGCHRFISLGYFEVLFTHTKKTVTAPIISFQIIRFNEPKAGDSV